MFASRFNVPTASAAISVLTVYNWMPMSLTRLAGDERTSLGRKREPAAITADVLRKSLRLLFFICNRFLISSHIGIADKGDLLSIRRPGGRIHRPLTTI